MIAEIFQARFLLLTLTGIAMLSLGLWLLFLNIESVVNRVFSAWLVLRGGFLILGPLLQTSTGATYEVLFEIVPYVLIPFTTLIIYFLSVFPRRRGIFGTTMQGPWILLGVTAGLMLWYMVDHSAFSSNGPAGPQGGPLLFFQGIRTPMFAIVALVLARDYARDPASSGGFSTFLMFAGFAINAVVDGTIFMVDVMEMIAAGEYSMWFNGFWMSRWLPALSFPIAAVSVGYLVIAMRHEATDATLQEARRFMFYVLPAAAFSAFAVSYNPWQIWAGDIFSFVLGMWRLVVPLLLAYALLRYSLFAIDLRLKAGVKRGIMMTVFAITFFAISEGAEAFLQAENAPMFGLVAAGVLAVAGRPLQKVGKRLADSLMPDTPALYEMGSRARFGMYRRQFLLVQQDGVVTPKERRMLDRLADLLEFEPGEANVLETGQAVARDDPAPGEPPKKPVSAVLVGTIAAGVTAITFGILSAVMEGLIGASDAVTGLVSSAAIALLLGPIESLAARLSRAEVLDPQKEQAMESALHEALLDGILSPRDLAFLGNLQEQLGIAKADRKRLERRVRRQLRKTTVTA